jgi:hypothetical protein
MKTQMNTNCEQVLNYCNSGSRDKYTIGNTTLNAISSIVPSLEASTTHCRSIIFLSSAGVFLASQESRVEDSQA